jgi:hypothetical protein
MVATRVASHHVINARSASKQLNSSPASRDEDPLLSFFSRARFILPFFIAKGYLPIKTVFTTPYKQYGCFELVSAAYFLATNVLRFMVFLLDLLRRIPELLDLMNKDDLQFHALISRIYVIGAGIFVTIQTIGVLVAAHRIRSMLLKDRHARVLCRIKPIEEATPVARFSRSQEVTFTICQILQLMYSAVFVIYYQYRELSKNPFSGKAEVQLAIRKWLLDLIFLDMTYLPDMTPLILLHLSQAFECVGKQLQFLSMEVSQTETEPSCNEVEVLSVKTWQESSSSYFPAAKKFKEIGLTWLRMKSTTESVGRAVSVYWTTLVLWTTASLSYQLYRLSAEKLDGVSASEKFIDHFLTRFGEKLLLMWLLCDAGQLVTNKAMLIDLFSSQS